MLFLPVTFFKLLISRKDIRYTSIYGTIVLLVRANQHGCESGSALIQRFWSDPNPDLVVNIRSDPDPVFNIVWIRIRFST